MRSKEKIAEEIVLIRYYKTVYLFLRQGWMILRDNA